MATTKRYVVDVVVRPNMNVVTMVVETPFGEYKAAAVAVLSLEKDNTEFRFGRITVREWASGDLDDPSRTVVDPWTDSAIAST